MAEWLAMANPPPQEQAEKVVTHIQTMKTDPHFQSEAEWLAMTNPVPLEQAEEVVTHMQSTKTDPHLQSEAEWFAIADPFLQEQTAEVATYVEERIVEVMYGDASTGGWSAVPRQERTSTRGSRTMSSNTCSR